MVEKGGRRKKNGNDTLECSSFLFYHSPPLLHPLLHPSNVRALLVSPGTLGFYRQRALTFEARFASEATRIEAMKGEYSAGENGRRGMVKSGDREEKRERTALCQDGRQTIEGTVGALNPFKYNQYR